jgi:hypothetical protein
VHWRELDGSLTRGAPVRRPPLRVTDADRLGYVAQFMATAVIAGRGEQGMAAMPASQKSPAALARLVTKQEFREVRPPFTDRTPLIAPDGTVWVERSVPVAAAPAWDRFDARGAHLGGIILPIGRRLLAVGARGLYTAAADADGVERLERYDLRLP